ncbi:MAG: hypothetical protein RIR33_1386 [Pseudomonadota bacterium]
MLTAPAMAQPDFAGAFKRLDANNDGQLSFLEIRYEGAEAARYGRPVESFVTDDGVGVELWRSPFGIREVSMSDELLELRRHDRARTFLRDERVQLAPWLMLAGNPELRTMTVERFENELRGRATEQLAGLDTDKHGAVSVGEVERLMALRKEHRRSNPDYLTGPGGEALEMEKAKLLNEYYASLDLNGDGQFTVDEMLEVILARLVAAYAPPA